MINYTYVEDVPLTDVKKILSNKGKDLSFEQKTVLDHAKMFVKLTPAQSEKMKNDLSGIDGITSELIAKTMDVLPNKIELDLITEKLREVSEAQKEEILKIVEKYKKDKE
jgi:DNA-directed RNA polymerase subunit F